MKLLNFFKLFILFGVFLMAVIPAQAAKGFIVQVKCKGMAPFQVVISTPSAGDAKKIAQNQNPGCSATVVKLMK